MLLMCGGMLNFTSFVSVFISLASIPLRTPSTGMLRTPAEPGLSIEAPIVGGTTVPPGEFSDVVLVAGSRSLCTGTLVAADVVLTAGHCIADTPKQVLVGSVDYSKPGGDWIAVKSATAYPDWEQRYDVGILVLERAASATPRAIAKGCRIAARSKVRAVGFGLTTASGTGSNTRLHQAVLTVDDPTCASDPACASAVAPGGEFTAGGDGADSCFGDSGGPLFMGNALIGVVSRGVGTSGSPCGGGGVYVRANKVVGWIERSTGRKLTRTGCPRPQTGDQASDEPSGAVERPSGTGQGVDDEAPDDVADPVAGDAAAANDHSGGCSALRGDCGLAWVALTAGLLLWRRRDTTQRTCRRFR